MLSLSLSLPSMPRGRTDPFLLLSLSLPCSLVLSLARIIADSPLDARSRLHTYRRANSARAGHCASCSSDYYIMRGRKRMCETNVPTRIYMYIGIYRRTRHGVMSERHARRHRSLSFSPSVSLCRHSIPRSFFPWPALVVQYFRLLSRVG